MEIFKTDSVASLQKESAGVMSVFEKTITKISILNDKIDAAINKRNEKIIEYDKAITIARIEKGALEDSKTKNSNFANKLMSFLED